MNILIVTTNWHTRDIKIWACTLLIMALSSCGNKHETFSSDKWKTANSTERSELLPDLFNQGLLYELETRSDAVELLGSPTYETSHGQDHTMTMAYDIYDTTDRWRSYEYLDIVYDTLSAKVIDIGKRDD